MAWQTDTLADPTDVRPRSVAACTRSPRRCRPRFLRARVGRDSFSSEYGPRGRTALPIFQVGRAAAMCSNQANLHLTLTDPKNGPELPQRPSMTCMRLVCIQRVVTEESAVRPRLQPILLPSRWTTPVPGGQLWNVGPAHGRQQTVLDDVHQEVKHDTCQHKALRTWLRDEEAIQGSVPDPCQNRVAPGVIGGY